MCICNRFYWIAPTSFKTYAVWRLPLRNHYSEPINVYAKTIDVDSRLFNAPVWGTEIEVNLSWVTVYGASFTFQQAIIAAERPRYGNILITTSSDIDLGHGPVVVTDAKGETTLYRDRCRAALNQAKAEAWLAAHQVRTRFERVG